MRALDLSERLDAVSSLTPEASLYGRERIGSNLLGNGSPGQAGRVRAISNHSTPTVPRSRPKRSNPAQSNQHRCQRDPAACRLPTAASNKGMNLLIAKRGKDAAFLPENTDYYWQDHGNWYKKVELRFASMVRVRRPQDVQAERRSRRKRLHPQDHWRKTRRCRRAWAMRRAGLTWSVKDPRNNEIAKGTGNLNAFGAFDFKFKLPDNANLGYARIDLTTNELACRPRVCTSISDPGISPAGI